MMRQVSRRLFSNVASADLVTKQVSLMSCPISFGQPLLGPDKSPNLLKDHGLIPLLQSCQWSVKVVPDMFANSPACHQPAKPNQMNAKNCSVVGAVCEQIMINVCKEAATDNFLLILGGDHCIPIGTLPGILSKRPSTGVVWVDAHADINTPKTSLSGNMHGMPVAFLLGLVENAQSYPNMSWFEPCLSPQDIVYIGLRDLDPAEKIVLKKLGILCFTMYDIDRYGIGNVMERCQAHLAHKEAIHLSFDIDALDPFFAPSTGTAVRGGLTFREGNYICETLCESGKLRSMELVEVNPSLHSAMDSKTTLDMSLTLIGSTMGQRIL